MRRLSNLATGLTLGLASLAAGSTPPTGRIPVLLELFTRKGAPVALGFVGEMLPRASASD
jgi:hypothetical protein